LIIRTISWLHEETWAGEGMGLFVWRKAITRHDCSRT
jgi:hypothetical protein